MTSAICIVTGGYCSVLGCDSIVPIVTTAVHLEADEVYQVATVVYTVKKFIDFPVSSRDVTDQTLPGREKFNYSRLGRA